MDSINGLLTWIGHGFGIHHLTLNLIIGYIFYPVTFLLGVPRAEILRVSQLFATKLVANEFAAYLNLQAITQSNNPLSPRAYTIASYGLCGFANLGSLGIQIGVLGALAPSRSKVIARIALSAMICGFLSTLQTAGIVYVFMFCSALICLRILYPAACLSSGSFSDEIIRDLPYLVISPCLKCVATVMFVGSTHIYIHRFICKLPLPGGK